MKLNRRLVLALTTLAALAALAPVARADSQIVPRLDLSAILLDQPKGRPWAIDLGFGMSLPTVDGTRPSPLRHAVFRFPQATVNADAFPFCTHAVLERKGPVACPKRTKIGSGTGLVDVRPLVRNILHATIDVYNGPKKGRHRTFLFFAHGEEVNADFVLDGDLVKTPGRYGYQLDLPIPPLKTAPGVPDVAIDELEVTIGKRIRYRGRRVSLLEAPTRCPAGGWPFDAALTFADGQQRKAAAVINCLLKATPVPA